MSRQGSQKEHSGTLSVRLDVVDHCIRVIGAGWWSPLMLERHIEELRRLLAIARSAGREVRILSDLREATVQQTQVAARIERLTLEDYGADVRIAVVVASNLLKLQLRRVVRKGQFETFLSMKEAETWLRDAQRTDDFTRGFIVRAPRRHTSIITTIENEEGQIWPIKLVNISASGVLIDGRRELDVGQRSQIMMPAIGVISGHIARIRDDLAGIRLDHHISLKQMGLA